MTSLSENIFLQYDMHDDYIPMLETENDTRSYRFC
jgi:DNA helicase HerA-like ATPase